MISMAYFVKVVQVQKFPLHMWYLQRAALKSIIFIDILTF